MTSVPKLRNSERSSFRRCPQQWWWGWREGLKPVAPPAPALWFGTGIHLALAEWYVPGWERGVDPRETWRKYVDDELRYIKANYRSAEGEAYEADWKEAGDLGETMLGEYLAWYGKDEHMEFIEPEQSGSVLIPDKTGEPIVEYCFTFDGVYRDHSKRNPEIKLLETKTAAQISTKHLTLDDQAGSYWAVATTQLRDAGKIGSKETLEGITYNFLRKADPDDRPTNEQGQALNKDGSVSKRQPTRNLWRENVRRSPSERNTQLKRIVAETKHMNMFRNRELPLYKNTTRECNFCPFFEMCELHEANADWQSYRDMMFRVEDPYRDHR